MKEVLKMAIEYLTSRNTYMSTLERTRYKRKKGFSKPKDSSVLAQKKYRRTKVKTSRRKMYNEKNKNKGFID